MILTNSIRLETFTIVALLSGVATALNYPIVDTNQQTFFGNQEELPSPPASTATSTTTSDTKNDPFYGQDAQFQTNNAPSYTNNNGDGTVSDLVTGLMWTQNYTGRLSYEDAFASASNVSIGGYSDWRIPTIQELYSLMDFSGTDISSEMMNYSSNLSDAAVPFIDTTYFQFDYGCSDDCAAPQGGGQGGGEQGEGPPPQGGGQGGGPPPQGEGQGGGPPPQGEGQGGGAPPQGEEPAVSRQGGPPPEGGGSPGGGPPGGGPPGDGPPPQGGGQPQGGQGGGPPPQGGQGEGPPPQGGQEEGPPPQGGQGGGPSHRLIDVQFATTTEYVDATNVSMARWFGVNFADGRIKGYGMPPYPQFFVRYVRGPINYGTNNFKDNGDGTVSDLATGFMWMQQDSLEGMDWSSALQWCENSNVGDFTDWHLPNAKELHSIVDYTRAPVTTGSAAIDPIFNISTIINENNEQDWPYFWTSTTHKSSTGFVGDQASYFCFGRCLGYFESQWQDVHGAGAQRSEFKSGDPAQFPTGRGPQGDAVRIYNHVRCVRTETQATLDEPDLSNSTALESSEGSVSFSLSSRQGDSSTGVEPESSQVEDSAASSVGSPSRSLATSMGFVVSFFLYISYARQVV